MVRAERNEHGECQKHHHRRSIIEGIFPAVERRMSQVIRSRIAHNREAEAVCRAVVVWNVLSLAYRVA